MRKPRIIIFDDDTSILKLFNVNFSVNSFEVQYFNKPLFCRACENTTSCANQCADIIITDFQMPRINGIELLNHHVQRRCPINIQNKAIMSGSEPHNVIDNMKGLANTFFQKPVRMEQLNAWTKECLSRSDLSQPLGNYFV